MSTLSIPVPPKLEELVNSLVDSGYGSNKADVVRRALILLAEEEAVNRVLKAEQEIREGKILRGDPKKLMRKI